MYNHSNTDRSWEEAVDHSSCIFILHIFRFLFSYYHVCCFFPAEPYALLFALSYFLWLQTSVIMVISCQEYDNPRFTCYCRNCHTLTLFSQGLQEWNRVSQARSLLGNMGLFLYRGGMRYGNFHLGGGRGWKATALWKRTGCPTAIDVHKLRGFVYRM